MRHESVFARLSFQILFPPLLGMFVIAVTFSALLWVSTGRFAIVQSQIRTINESTAGLLEIARLRGETKEELLLFRLGKNEINVRRLELLEETRIAISLKLKELVTELEPDEILLESFFAGSEETRGLRDKYLSVLRAGREAHADEIFKNYSSLFDINSARLADMLAFLRRRLASSEAQIHSMIESAVAVILALMLLTCFGAWTLVGYYRRRLLWPLQILQSGLRDVTAGKLGVRLPDLAGPNELSDVTRGFNLMTEELQRTTGDLTNAREEALRSANVKAEFLANMSHEIRTPLNVIIGISSLLSEKPEQAAPEQLEQFGILQNSGRILLNTVNDILDYSRFESEQVQLASETFDLRKSLSGIADILRPSAIGKGLLFELRMTERFPSGVIGDRHRIEQILLNFANNAIKFTDRGSVLIDADVSVDGGDVNHAKLKLQVTDTGIGISDKTLGRLFRRFEQARSSLSGARGGTGLGLAIVKQIVDLMGGKVAATSTLGEGSCFSVELPIRIAPRSHATDGQVGGKKTASIDLAGKRILVVDDSADNRFLIRRYFEKSGASIEERANGNEAVSAARETRYDMILMDIQMPELDGYQATEEIRKLEKTRAAAPSPIIALTAFAMQGEVEKCLRAGCNAHLAKPILKADLMKMVGDLLSRTT
jgi:signal transduction histidine kinase/CheY-like chemotaxis protein